MSHILKKGQTATEYMIILAVVIIIALIVVGVMGGIPGVGVGARNKASAAYWRTAPIAITAYSATAADVVTLYIRNNNPDSITLDEVNLSASGSSVASFDADQESITLGPGEEKEFTFSGGNVVTAICNTAGDSFTSNVWMNYTDDETGAIYVFTGNGNKLEGTCAE